MRCIYTFFVRCYWLLIRLTAVFGNVKARKMVAGQSSLRNCNPHSGDEWIWFHVSSLGEFEQCRPLIEKIKEQHAESHILLTFFSPSGYEVRKRFPLADKVAYLPADTQRNARRLLSEFNVKLAVFVKYEFWFNYIKALDDNRIPLFYISVILPEDSYFFRWYGRWFLKKLRTVNRFFVQDETTQTLLNRAGILQTTVCGDTRFDRVHDISVQARRFPEIESFIGGRKCFMMGSSWHPDEKLLAGCLACLPDDYCVIVAPHDISENHISQIVSMFPDSQLYTGFDSSKQTRMLIINTIGILSQLYQYARFAYVGGGFGAGLHNIQEPITFGCPVIVGGHYSKFKEAVDLVNAGGVFAVRNQDDFNLIVGKLACDDAFRDDASTICRSYVESQIGATKTILENISSFI